MKLCILIIAVMQFFSKSNLFLDQYLQEKNNIFYLRFCSDDLNIPIKLLSQINMTSITWNQTTSIHDFCKGQSCVSALLTFAI